MLHFVIELHFSIPSSFLSLASHSFFEQNDSVPFLCLYSNLNSVIARQQACIQIAAAIYTQAYLRTSLFCFPLYQLSLRWVKYRAQPEAIST